MKYLSVCSGIEAASVAWQRFGWTPVGVSEIELFPIAVLAHRFPSVPNFGDMTKFQEWPIEPRSFDVLVGGTPCQSFSVAGLRQGLSDPRGGLMLTYLEIARRFRPRWIVWENVPGVLSSGRGRDFGSFLGALGELGYGFAYRVLDAQWCRVDGWPKAVPQRRRRVFVVGCAGDWKRAAQVLFESESVCRDSSEGGAKGEAAAGDAEACAGTVSSKWAKGTGGPAGDECYNLTVHPFTKSKRAQSATDDETWVPGQVNPTLSLFDQGDTRATTVAVAFANRTRDGIKVPEVMADGIVPALTNPGNGGRSDAINVAVAQDMTVRRLTPRECERLQGFPDGYTAIPWRGKPAEQCPDGPRYKALGNSMAVNCMAWIGQRIAEVSK